MYGIERDFFPENLNFYFKDIKLNNFKLLKTKAPFESLLYIKIEKSSQNWQNCLTLNYGKKVHEIKDCSYLRCTRIFFLLKLLLDISALN